MIKRLLSLLLALVTVFSLAATAFAEDGPVEGALVLTELAPEELDEIGIAAEPQDTEVSEETPINDAGTPFMSASGSEITLTSDTAIDLYALDDSYNGYLSIPSGYPQECQLKLTDSGTPSYSVVKGDSVTVTDEGLIRPAQRIMYWNGNIGTSEPTGQEGERKVVSHNFGTSVVQVAVGGKTYRVTVTVWDYATIYAQGVMDKYLADNITAGMTDLEKLEVIAAFPTPYNYDASYASASSMIIFGGGDCWASTEAIIYLCEQVGMRAKSHDAPTGQDGNAHVNAVVAVGGKFYIVEAGFNEPAPRSYMITEATGLYEYISNGDGTVSLSRYNGFGPTATIPSSIDGYTVTGIGHSLFYNDNEVTSVTIPNTVTTIGEAAFYMCSNLKSVTIPNSVTTIGDYAFSDCFSLEAVVIPSGVTAIGNGVFDRCVSMKTITIPDTVTTIGEWAFNECNLKSLKLPKNLTKIEHSAFFRCAGLTELAIPDKVIEIGEWAFSQCPDLKTVTISESVTTIGDGAFLDCPALETVTILNAKCSIYDRPEMFGTPGAVTICGHAGSTAEKYAEKYGYAFKDVDASAPAPSPTPAPKPEAKLATPKLKSVSNETGGLKISWSAVEGAEMYRILYKTSEKGEWKTLKDVSSAGYTFKTAKSGTKYWFTIQCVSKDGKTEKSDYNTTGKSITYFAAPKMKAVENTTGGLKISWSKVDGAAKYRIYYKTSENGSWKKLKDVGNVASYTYKTAKSGTKYWFTVRAMSSTKKTLSGYGSSVKSITYFSAPKLTAVEKTSKGIKISWNKADGAAKYRIYYKTSADGKWKKLKDVGKVDNYTFKTAKSGTTYWFTVRAMSSTKKTLSGYGSSVMSINYRK